MRRIVLVGFMRLAGMRVPIGTGLGIGGRRGVDLGRSQRVARFDSIGHDCFGDVVAVGAFLGRRVFAQRVGVLGGAGAGLPATAIAAVAAVAPAFGTIIVELAFAIGARILFEKRLTIGHGNLIIIGVNFAEGEEAMAVAAIIDEGRLE